MIFFLYSVAVDVFLPYSETGCPSGVPRKQERRKCLGERSSWMAAQSPLEQGLVTDSLDVTGTRPQQHWGHGSVESRRVSLKKNPNMLNLKWIILPFPLLCFDTHTLPLLVCFNLMCCMGDTDRSQTWLWWNSQIWRKVWELSACQKSRREREQGICSLSRECGWKQVCKTRQGEVGLQQPELWQAGVCIRDMV